MFNINEFKSVMNKYGGPAKSNLFVMKIYFPSLPTDLSTNNSGAARTQVGVKYSKKQDFINDRELTFFCSEVSLPPINVNVASYKENSIDISQSIPINLTTPSINATFMLDSDHRVISFFHSWMQEVINYNTESGLLASINADHLPYEIGYKSDYACNIDIIHFKTNSTGSIEEGYRYSFYNAFPTEVGGKILSWSPNDNIATVNINFSASSYNFSGSLPGDPVADLSRGNGYLDFLNSVGFRGQSVQQRNLPQSIQDAINTFTTVRNDFRTLRNTFNSFRNLF